MSTYAGSVEGYEDGPLLQAKFSCPRNICVSKSGYLVVSDRGNHKIRIIRYGMVTTIAGCDGVGTTPLLTLLLLHY